MFAIDFGFRPFFGFWAQEVHQLVRLLPVVVYNSDPVVNFVDFEENFDFLLVQNVFEHASRVVSRRFRQAEVSTALGVGFASDRFASDRFADSALVETAPFVAFVTSVASAAVGLLNEPDMLDLIVLYDPLDQKIHSAA